MSQLANKDRVRKNFNRAASSYDSVAVLQRMMVDELISRLELIKDFSPQVILDAGAGTGYAANQLNQYYPDACTVGLDIAHRMMVTANIGCAPNNWITGDLESLPLADRSVDLIMCNASIQWCDPARVFSEFARVLNENGLMLFSSFGPDTLKEIRQAWQETDPSIEHVHLCYDMHDLGDLMQEQGFTDPVVDMQPMTMTYATANEVLLDLKRLGSVYAGDHARAGLTGRRRFRQFTDRLAQQRNDEGRIALSYELIFGHAWMSAQRNRELTDGSVTVALPSAHSMCLTY